MGTAIISTVLFVVMTLGVARVMPSKKAGGAQGKVVTDAAAARNNDPAFVEGELKKLREDLDAKHKKDLAGLEEKLRESEEQKKNIEADTRAKVEEELKKRSEDAWARAEESWRKAQASARTSAAPQETLKELDNFKSAVDETIKTKEAAFAQTKATLAAANQESYQMQVTSLETRLAAMEENKKGLEDKLSAAVTAVVTLDETAKKLKDKMALGAGGQSVGVSASAVAVPKGMDVDVDTLNRAKENVIKAMENVKLAMRSSMAGEARMMKTELASLSGSVGRFSAAGKEAAPDKANMPVHDVDVSMAVVIGAAGLKEEAFTIKEKDGAPAVLPRTEVGTAGKNPAVPALGAQVASLNRKLEGLEVSIDSDFKANIPESPRAAREPDTGKDAIPAITGCDCRTYAGLQTTGVMPQSAAADKASFGAYVVKKGDSLWRIAARKDIYGDPLMWPLIFKYNLSIINDPEVLRLDAALSVLKTPAPGLAKAAAAAANRHYRERVKPDYVKKLRAELEGLEK